MIVKIEVLLMMTWILLYNDIVEICRCIYNKKYMNDVYHNMIGDKLLKKMQETKLPQQSMRNIDCDDF